MKVRDAMTKRVSLIEPGTTLAAASRRMRDEDIGCLIVNEGDRLAGVVTDRDIVVRALAAGKDPNRFTVQDIMSAEVLHCYEDQDVDEARRIMAENQVRRLPVLNRRDRPVGMVTLHDLAGGRLRTKPVQVTFYKRLASSQGHEHNVTLATVYITDRHGQEDVIAAAIRKFERDRNVSPWHRLADGYEVVGPHPH